MNRFQLKSRIYFASQLKIFMIYHHRPTELFYGIMMFPFLLKGNFSADEDTGKPKSLKSQESSSSDSDNSDDYVIGPSLSLASSGKDESSAAAIERRARNMRKKLMGVRKSHM